MTEPLRDSDPREVGGYTLESRLGAGGMGTVYLARSPSGEARAIKVLHAELSGSQELRLRLEREAAVLQRLRGDRSAAVYEINATAERPYLVMEYVSGLSLDKHIAKYGKRSGVLVWAVMDALLEATEMFHAEGITHRDLKPSNVMLGEDGVKIIDFGISGLMGSSLTEIGSTPATTLWSSPEQMNGAEVGQASDIFNLGMIFAYAWTGSHPFDAAKRDAVMLKLMTGEPNLAGVPSRLRQIVADCLAKDPAQRPSAREVRDRLRLISRSSSNSDSGSRSGDLGSPLTGTVLVNVAEEIQSRPREQIGRGAELKNRPMIAAAAAVVAVLALGVIIASRGGDSGGGDNEIAAEISNEETTTSSAVKSLEDLEEFQFRNNPGSYEPERAGLKFSSHSRFDSQLAELRFGFGGKERNPIKVRLTIGADREAMRDDLERLLASHLNELGPTRSIEFVRSIPEENCEWLSPLESSNTSPSTTNEEAEARTEVMACGIQNKDDAADVWVVLAEQSIESLNSYREALRDRDKEEKWSLSRFDRESDSVALPDGWSLDVGWGVKPGERRGGDKVLDSAIVVISREVFAGENLEGVLLLLARGVLLGLGAMPDAQTSTIMSVENGRFVRSEYYFSSPDRTLVSGLFWPAPNNS